MANKKIISTDQRGLTLAEMLVAVSIMTILMAIISVFVIRSFSINRYVLEQGLNISILENSLRSISSNLREARQAEDGKYLIESCQEYQLVFYSDIDNDDVSERLEYFLENNQLKLEVTEPDLSQVPASYESGTATTKTVGGGIVNEGMAEPLFYYYQEDEEFPLEGEIDVGDVRLVRVRIYANIDTEQVPDSMVMETMIRPRNIP